MCCGEPIAEVPVQVEVWSKVGWPELNTCDMVSPKVLSPSIVPIACVLDVTYSSDAGLRENYSRGQTDKSG